MFLLSIADPTAVFLTIREAERIKEIADFVLLHETREVGADLDDAFAFIRS